jgi:hypothetical protein
MEQQNAKQTLDGLLKDKSIKRTSDFGKDVIAEFNDLMEGKKNTPDNVKKYFAKAFREAKQTSQFADAYTKAT